MLLGLGSGYRGPDERLDRGVFSAVLALIGGGMVLLLALTFLSFPEWIAPRRFATWLLDSRPTQSADRDTVRLLPAPDDGKLVRGSSSSLIEPEEDLHISLAAVPPDEDGLAAMGLLEASRVQWAPAAAPKPTTTEGPPARFRDILSHVPPEVISAEPALPESRDLPPADPAGACEGACDPPETPVEATPGPPTEPVNGAPGRGSAAPGTSPGKPADPPAGPPGSSPNAPAEGPSKGNAPSAPPGQGGERSGRGDR